MIRLLFIPDTGKSLPPRMCKTVPVRSSHFAPQKVFACFLLLLLCGAGWAQEQSLQYAINRHGKRVGELTFKQVKESTKTTYTVESLVKVSILLSFTVQAWENSVYENDVLQSSSLVRKVNGKERTNKVIKTTGSGLTISNKNEEKVVKNYLVKYSTHCLYVAEPVSYTNVFSDNYQQFIPIQKLAVHHYKISFPDGGSNEYFYENGICKKVKVRSSLFDAEFVLVSP